MRVAPTAIVSAAAAVNYDADGRRERIHVFQDLERADVPRFIIFSITSLRRLTSPSVTCVAPSASFVVKNQFHGALVTCRVHFNESSMQHIYRVLEVTRSSADADNGLDAFVGQSRSTNILVPFQVK